MNYPLAKPGYYFSLFGEVVGFIRQPKIEKALNKTTRMKIYDTLGLYVLKMVCLIPLILFFAIVYDPKNVLDARMAERFSPLMFFMVGGFILPLVEEVAFRLSLKFKPVYFALSASVFLYYILSKLVFQTKISAVDESFVLRMVISVSSGIVLYSVTNHHSIRDALFRFWEKHFRSIFYLSCIVFAWVHVTKYELNALNVLLLPILTLPQLMSAVINGYTRVTFGFQYPLLFHISNNLLGIGLSFLPLNDLIF